MFGSEAKGTWDAFITANSSAMEDIAHLRSFADLFENASSLGHSAKDFDNLFRMESEISDQAILIKELIRKTGISRTALATGSKQLQRRTSELVKKSAATKQKAVVAAGHAAAKASRDRAAAEKSHETISLLEDARRQKKAGVLTLDLQVYGHPPIEELSL